MSRAERWWRAAVRATRTDQGLALLLGIAVFGLYSTTMGQPVGYEGQSTAVTEGLITAGKLEVLPSTRFLGPNFDPRTLSSPKIRYAVTGLPEPLLQAPLYFIGEQLDHATSNGIHYRWRMAITRLYNPLMAAIAVVAIFALLRIRGRPRRRALGVAALAAVGSMIWPYSKIGMETTMMTLVALMVLATAWATSRGGLHRYALAGLAAGAAAAAKPVGIVMLVGLLPFARPVFSMPSRERWRMLAAFLLPLLAWGIAIAWYNAYRKGSIFDFNSGYDSNWPAAPSAAVGMLVSPGKGLLLYSPLAILGLLGIRQLWREDRQLALVITTIFLANLVVISGSNFWSEDTWGPRYMVTSAWLLLLPIAWWVHTPRRRRVLAAVAIVAVVFQLAGVFVWYGVSVRAQRAFSGTPVYLYGGYSPSQAPYGDDAPAWIPGVSELWFQTELLAAWVKEQLTGTGFTVSYNPYWGRTATIDLTHPKSFVGRALPDFWWHYPGQTSGLEGLAAVLGLLGLAAGATLLRVAWRPTTLSGIGPPLYSRSISSS